MNKLRDQTLEHSIKSISNSQKEMVITISKDELEPILDKKFKEIQPQVNLKGFRKGKVPMKMVKKLYGQQVEMEAQQEASSQLFTQIAKNEDIKVVGTPELADIKYEDDNIEFVIKYEVLPDFELADYKGLTLDEPVHNVEEEEIDKEIENICRNNGDLVTADEISDEQHVAGLKLTEIDNETGVPLVGSEEQDIQVYLADQTVLPDLREKLMNTKVGDSFNFNPHDSDPQAPDKEYKMTVTSIQKLVPKEFTNEFVSTYTQGKFVTTDEFREEIGYKLQEKWDEKGRQEMENQIVNKLVEMHDFEPPESVLRNVMEVMLEDIKKQYKDNPQAKHLTVDMIKDDLRPSAIHRTKWTMIRNAIIEKEGIEVEDYDIEPIAEQEAQRINSDKDALMNQLMNNRDFKENILSKKLLELLLDFAITEELTFDEYQEKYYAHVHDHDHDHEHDHDHDHDHDEESKQSNIVTPGSEDKSSGGIITP